jgi:hypothetical protein
MELVVGFTFTVGIWDSFNLVGRLLLFCTTGINYLSSGSSASIVLITALSTIVRIPTYNNWIDAESHRRHHVMGEKCSTE